MGKRKRTADNKKAPPPDFIPPAPQVDLQRERRSSEVAESSATQSLASIMDAMDRSVKRSPAHQSPLYHPNHPIMLRHSRHPPIGRHYSRRSSVHHSEASPSNWKGTPTYDATSLFKLESKDLSSFPYRDSRERIFQKPERIRSTPSTQYGGVSRDIGKMECRICNKRLKKTQYVLDNSMPLSDVSVVAVLVCGHTYHADCLEQETGHGDRQDPPCPLCVGHMS